MSLKRLASLPLRTGSLTTCSIHARARTVSSFHNASQQKHTSSSSYLLLKRPIPLSLPVTRPRHNWPWRCTHGRRSLSTIGLPGFLVPPLVFVGLFITLWAYKCCMMIIFQNKIIYMPSVPPFSRGEKIEDYAASCRPVAWEEKQIRSLDGTKIALCVGRIAGEAADTARGGKKRKHVVVLYFQGNASSLPPRLPFLSASLKTLQQKGGAHHDAGADYTIVALSYRGYWTSRGRASQRGIELDARAALRWVEETYPPNDPSVDNRVVLWGQSIGAGVATSLLMQHLSSSSSSSASAVTATAADIQIPRRIHGLILETPFLSIRSMLAAIYPQKWLPYKYLWPFLRNWWDSEIALKSIGEAKLRAGEREREEEQLPILIITAKNDELVPAEQADVLEKLCAEVGLRDVSRVDVGGALHTNATIRAGGRVAVARFLRRMGEEE
ncbi:hypothetical protein AJ80_04642 [Polytolypa hystricis UAMH7299]|uniref:AB hydrolase-1 domain-containing protein n=1 Tax=Polytolypa hystricis (strain UAMH7299) TaxID=1447883 RepID=A0A2B7YA95_POLH7|nr:hypothetical protein AJ80_04642 [Polytolypa hystricis UAMH7299]